MLKDFFTFQEIWDLATISRFDQSKIDIPVFNNPILDSMFIVEKRTKNLTALKLKRSTKKLEYKFEGFLANKTIRMDSACDFVSIFLDYLARPQRYEPENVYKLHTLVPTVRTTFPYEFLISFSDENRSRTYRYHSSYHAIELIEERESSLECKGNVSIICRALYWKLAQRYGEFAPYLVHLEAGALKTLAIQLLKLFGFDKVQEDANLFNLSQNDSTQKKFERDVFKISASSSFNWRELIELKRIEVKAFTLGDNCILESRFPQLIKFINHFHSPDYSGEKADKTTQAGEYISSNLGKVNYNLNYQPKFSDYFEALHFRSAANDSSGVTSLLLNPSISIIQNVCNLADQLELSNFRVAASELIDTNYLAIQSRNNNEKGFFNYAIQKITDEFNIFELLAEALPNKAIKINFTSMVGMFLLTIDSDAAEKKYPDCTARAVHQAAGARMFNLSVAASAYGFYVRPMRMLLESVLEHKLPIKGKIIFQIVLGYRRRTNLSFRL